MIHRAIYSASNGLLKRQFYFQNQMSFSSMSRRRTYIDLEEIPTLKQAYEERRFSPRNLKRAVTRKGNQLIYFTLTLCRMAFLTRYI